MSKYENPNYNHKTREFFGMDIVESWSSSESGCTFFLLMDKSGKTWWTTTHDTQVYERSQCERYYEQDRGFREAQFNGATIEHNLDLAAYAIFDPVGAEALRFLEEKYDTIFDIYGNRTDATQGWSIKFPSAQFHHIDRRSGRRGIKNVDRIVRLNILEEWKQKCIELGGGENLKKYSLQTKNTYLNMGGRS